MFDVLCREALPPRRVAAFLALGCLIMTGIGCSSRSETGKCGAATPEGWEVHVLGLDSATPWQVALPPGWTLVATGTFGKRSEYREIPPGGNTSTESVEGIGIMVAPVEVSAPPPDFTAAEVETLPSGRIAFTRVSVDTGERTTLLRGAHWEARFDESNFVPVSGIDVTTIVDSFGDPCQ